MGFLSKALGHIHTFGKWVAVPLTVVGVGSMVVGAIGGAGDKKQPVNPIPQGSPVPSPYNFTGGYDSSMMAGGYTGGGPAFGSQINYSDPNNAVAQGSYNTFQQQIMGNSMQMPAYGAYNNIGY